MNIKENPNHAQRVHSAVCSAASCPAIPLGEGGGEIERGRQRGRERERERAAAVMGRG